MYIFPNAKTRCDVLKFFHAKKFNKHSNNNSYVNIINVDKNKDAHSYIMYV